jgi:hypothetical protein
MQELNSLLPMTMLHISRLDKKTYCIQFKLEMFISRWYNWRETYDVVSFTMDGNKQEKKWLVVEHKALKWAKAKNSPPKGLP